MGTGTTGLLAARVAVALTFLSFGGWIATACTTQWVMKKNAYYRIEAGLFQVRLQKGYIAVLAKGLTDPLTGDGLKWLHSLGDRHVPLQEFRQYMCALPRIPHLTENTCFIWQGVQFSSWGVIVGVSISFFIMMAGCYMVYWYTIVKARRSVRVWAKVLFAIGPLFQIVPLVVYTYSAVLVQDMFPRIGGASTIGHSLAFAVTAAVLSLLPLLLVGAFMEKSLDEEFNEAVSEEKKLRGVDGAYGAEFYGAAGPSSTPGSVEQFVAPMPQEQPAGYGQMAHSGQSFSSAGSGQPQFACGYAAPGAYGQGDPGYGAQIAYGSALQAPGQAAYYPPATASDWQSQPAPLRKGVTYVPDKPPGSEA